MFHITVTNSREPRFYRTHGTPRCGRGHTSIKALTYPADIRQVFGQFFDRYDFVVAVLSPYGKIPRQLLKIGHGHFLQHRCRDMIHLPKHTPFDGKYVS